MSDRITVDFDLIERHAARVEQVAGDVAIARQAVDSMNLGGGAFGLMCNFLVLPASIVQNIAASSISNAQHMVERSAREIRAAGRDLAAHEQQVIDELKPLQREVEQVGLR